ncbi:oxidoreductase-like protein [Glonium stellatum]|uniref:Oxidoreductase-like protein n=1 Tax=Glonium stellatum TaxID=574774 RepID=A0A8E2EXJ3_9PEZI|nr:oxidoreductase-like protein [Glonium stellatum]
MSTDPRTEFSSTGLNFTPNTHSDTYPFIDPTKHNLSGKSALVTGASKGIGRSTALSFARAGASNIAIAARSSLSVVAEEIRKAAKAANRHIPNVLEIRLDVTDKDSVDDARKLVSDKFGGKLDILISNAGSSEPWVPLVDSDPDNWWSSYTTNVKGQYLVTRAFLPLLFKSELKTIVGLSSIGANIIMPGGSAYQTAKLALLRFMEFVNTEYGETGIVAYCVHPGGVDTELARNMPENAHAFLVDTPELSGDSIVWLTSERREWLRGRYVSCTWDMEQLLGKKEEIVKNELLKVRLCVA